MVETELRQKVRNRAIAITDIAISKVRRKRFNGLDREQEEFIRDRHIELLKTAKELNEKYNTNEMEVGILINMVSWEYWVIKGNSNRVDIDSDKDARVALKSAGKNQLIFMHNHPSTGTFSGKDLKVFCLNEPLYIMTAVGNDGTIYSMTKTSNFSINILGDYAKIAAEYMRNGYKNNGTLAVRYILKNAIKYGIEYRKGSHK